MVKVRLQGPQRSTAWLNLAVAASAVFLMLVVWWVWPRETAQPAVQRELTDTRMTWKCPRGHRFVALGQVAARACPECGAPSHIVLTYRCPKHGAFEVSVRYRRNENGGITLGEVRFEGGEWQAVAGAVCCPRCGRPAHPVRDTAPFRGKREGR